MMNCDRIERLLGVYVDDEVPPTVRDEIESHVSVCGNCRTELREFQELAVALAGRDPVSVPPDLWSAIQRRLELKVRPRRLFFQAFGRRPVQALAASIVIVVGLGLFGLPWGGDRASQVNAATVDFSVLLDALQHDSVVAFDKFLSQYKASPTTPAEAKRYAAALDFALPQVLPGGFQLQTTYTLRFGEDPGVAARYVRDGEFLGVLFHAPILREHFGTHRDRECVVGKHRGHKVPVGEWSLVHLTDATTCHCLLSRLNEGSEIPAVLAAVAPSASTASENTQHDEHEHNP